MINRFYISLLIISSFLHTNILHAEDLSINAKTIEIEKTNKIVNAIGDVEVTDKKKE